MLFFTNYLVFFKYSINAQRTPLITYINIIANIIFVTNLNINIFIKFALTTNSQFAMLNFLKLHIYCGKIICSITFNLYSLKYVKSEKLQSTFKIFSNSNDMHVKLLTDRCNFRNYIQRHRLSDGKAGTIISIITAFKQVVKQMFRDNIKSSKRLMIIKHGD